jgi:hypothetical protein
LNKRLQTPASAISIKVKSAYGTGKPPANSTNLWNIPALRFHAVSYCHKPARHTGSVTRVERCQRPLLALGTERFNEVVTEEEA